MTQAIELTSGLDVQEAQRSALSALAEREQAEQAVVMAKAELARVRESFMADPTPSGDTEVERAEQAVRSAERYAEAMFARLNAAEKTLNGAQRSAAIRDLALTGEERDQEIRPELVGHFHELRSLQTQASQRVALILSVLHRDSLIVEKANALARTAGVSGSARPIDPDLLRMAFGIWLAGNRPRPRHAVTQDAARPMMVVLGELSRDALSGSDRAGLCRLALDEFVRVTESEVGDWFTPRHLPSFMASTPSATRHQQARSLLTALLQGDR